MFLGNIDEEEKNIKIKKDSVRGEDIETEINVSLEEAFYGADKKKFL